MNETKLSQVPASRSRYDLSHWNFTLGAIGSLQVENYFITLPGDSIAVDWRSVERLSPLRRNMSADALVHKFAMWVPMRHVYSNWVDFIKDGHDEGVTLGSYTTNASTPIYCTGESIAGGQSFPKWLIVPYMKVFNRFFKLPTAPDLADNYLITASEQERYYGLACGHEKAIWNTGLAETLSSSDRQYSVSGSVVDLPDFANKRSYLKSEITRDYTANRYREILQRVWGSDVNIDADQRPELLAHTKQWLSGYDVNVSDTAGVGGYSGRAVGQSRLAFPPKFFAEHGVLLLMRLVRFPPIYGYENQYLATKPEPTYQQISGDPILLSKAEPYDMTLNDISIAGGATSLGQVPAGQYFRTHKSHVHYKYNELGGHPFLSSPFSALSDVTHCDSFKYDSMFQSSDMKHWNAQSYVQAERRSFVPDIMASIYAGT